MRSLDASHLAAALSLGADLAAVISYDERLTAAAAALGLPVLAPHQQGGAGHSGDRQPRVEDFDPAGAQEFLRHAG